MKRAVMVPGLLALAAGWLTGAALLPAADDQDRLQVGLQPDGRIVVPTNQILKPAGQQITFPGRPVDLAFAENGRVLVVKNMSALEFIDVGGGKIKQTLPLPVPKDGPRPGFGVVGLLAEDDRIYVTDAQDGLHVAQRAADDQYEWVALIKLEKPKDGRAADPTGLARASAEHLLVTTTRNNCVQVVNIKSGRVEQVVPVGVAPYTVVVAGPDRAYVSNWGGDPPKPGEEQQLSSGTPVRTDPRTSVAVRGSVSVLARTDGKWRQERTIAVGLHPCGLSLSASGKFLYVANANSDTVSVIDTAAGKVVETIRCRPEGRLPFGSGSNALALNPDGATLYVANGTNNCVAVVRLAAGSSEGPAAGRPAKSEVAGLVPTGWFPGALALAPDGKRLYVANVKGHGSLAASRPALKGRNTHEHLGSVSVIDVPDAGPLAAYTQEVNANNRLGYSLAGLDKPRPDAPPVPVPQRHGEPSLIQHVIYIVKENRTYDQVFGNLKEGNGEPGLCIFGEEVTPNHHKLAREFTLFDNFYCSGVASGDGHYWATAAYVTDYLEKRFGSNASRMYSDDGYDVLANPASGFLWDGALARGKTVRNYGEYTLTTFEPASATWSDLFADYRDRTSKVKVTVNSSVKALEPYTHPTFAWWPPLMSDVAKARLFIDDLKEFEKKGELPNLILLMLPNDHTSGTSPAWPTPRAMVADNDLALGQIVEAVSQSKFWPRTCIFVVEDDPQDGFDHVDSHRTVALVVSPYTRRKFVDHTNYNQTGMVKTMELILGLPPMNQLDLSATPMRACFQDEPDLTPYTAVPNRVALDEMNPRLTSLQGKALYWAQKSLALDTSGIDRADEDTFNRILWHATRGYDAPYPEHYAGGKDEDDEGEDEDDD
jgi:YVTN family beta-propeller protein